MRGLHSKLWRAFPPTTSLPRFPRRNKGCCGLCSCLPPSCSGRTAFICFGSRLELTRGSVCDETCLGNHLPREGWGHAAQAASQLFCAWFWCGSSPGCCPQAPSSQTESLLSGNSFPRLTRRRGGSLPCHSTPSPTRLHLPPGSTPASHTSPAPHPRYLEFPGVRLRFPSRCPGMGSLTCGCCQGQEPSCPMDTGLFLTKKCQKPPLNVSPNKLLFATSVHQ